MSDFQASLFDTVTQDMSITLDQSCETLTIVDKSNYSTSTEDGHLLADFSTFRQLKIQSPSGTSFWYDAEGNLDGSWDAPNGGTDTIAHALQTTDDDGVYIVTLYVVPDYDNTVEYSYTNTNPKFVYYLNKLYRNKAITQGNLPTDTTYWEEVTVEDLSAKYYNTQTFALTCRNLFTCYEDLVHKANCIIVDDICNDNQLCSNKDFLEATKLRMLLDGIAYSANRSDWEGAIIKVNAAKKICNC